MTDQGYPPPEFQPPPWQPLGYVSAGQDVPHRPWRTGSIVFGIIAMIGGALSGCMGIFAPLALLVSPQPAAAAPAIGGIISAVLLYLGTAISLIWWGIGAVKMRRWARPLAVCVGALGAIGGVLMTIWMGILMPTIGRISATRPGVELFFRFLKGLLGMRHLLSERPQGVDIQIYCAVMACLLIYLQTGKKPGKLMAAMVGWYLLGIATEEEVIRFLNRPDNTGVKLKAKAALWKKLGVN